MKWQNQENNNTEAVKFHAGVILNIARSFANLYQLCLIVYDDELSAEVQNCIVLLYGVQSRGDLTINHFNIWRELGGAQCIEA